MSAAEELFRQHQPTALRIARGFKRKLPHNVLVEDLEAAAMLGLWQAVNARRDESFEWYMRKRVRGAIIDELRRQDWLSRRARQDSAARGEPMPRIGWIEEIDFFELQSSVASPEEVAAKNQECRSLHAALARLPRRHRVVMEALFAGKPQKEIASELGVSAPRMSQIVAAALARLRDSPVIA